MEAPAPARRDPAASPALRIAILYVVIGVIWIVVSDQVADFLLPAPNRTTQLQTMKGWAFVVGSGVFFYLLIEHYWRKSARLQSMAEQAQRRLALLVGNLPGMVYRQRAGGDARMEFVSEACRAITGYPPEELADGRAVFRDLIVEEDREDVERAKRHALERRAPFVTSYRLRTASGEEKWVAEHGVGIYAGETLEAVDGYISDITEHKRYEQQMFQAEKMNAVGRMAAGVAHDLNNVLFAILGLSELLTASFPAGSQESHYVGEIHAAGERAASLVRQMVTIARRQPARTEVVDLAYLMRNLESFLERITGKHVKLAVTLPDHAVRITADPGQIEQILMNLAINARDAMPQGGQLMVALEEAQLDENDAFSQLDLKAGSYAVISVSDTGCGMDKETLARIFEPFFTTKPPEHGTGLGLTTTYSIVRQYGGSVRVYSEPGHGSTFRVYLPLTPGGEAARAEPAAPARREGAVLVVDDEPSVLRVVSAMLEEAGFTVLPACSAEEAIDILERLDQPPTLLLTDLVLPGMNGRELGLRLRERHPTTPVLYMSGFADTMIFRREEMGALEAYMEKPVTPRALVQKVSDLLRRASA